MSLVPLTCAPMNYKWGKIGTSSLVYQLLSKSQSNIKFQESEPYSELWMGDHPSAPSYTQEGQRISDKYGNIHFLAKILSINTPLSLQCHPNKAQAEQLHSRNSQFYPDDNDKPEMGIFLTRTILLYGFRQYSSIVHFLNNISEFAELCGRKQVDAFCSNPSSSTLKNLITALLHSSKSDIERLSASFLSRLSTSEYRQSHELSENSIYILDSLTHEAIQHISNHFPNDIGIFFPLILNVLDGNYGDALYIPPGTLHAYLKGDLFEIMNVSDNVLRAAMTPKHIDIENLLKVVNFRSFSPLWVKPTQQGQTSIYCSPDKKFLIHFINPDSNSKIALPSQNRLSILLNLSGQTYVNGKVIKQGSVHLIPKMTSLEISSINEKSVLIYASSPLDES